MLYYGIKRAICQIAVVDPGGGGGLWWLKPISFVVSMYTVYTVMM